jgi:hypothetical protein
VRSWGLSAAEQYEVWRRWRQGESLRLIARRLGRRAPSVRAFVLQSGGGATAPAPAPSSALSGRLLAAGADSRHNAYHQAGGMMTELTYVL